MKLTPRELEIVKLVCADLRYKEIGARLGIAPKSAATRVQWIRERHHCASVVGLVRLAIRDGVVNPDDPWELVQI